MSSFLLMVAFIHRFDCSCWPYLKCFVMKTINKTKDNEHRLTVYFSKLLMLKQVKIRNKMSLDLPLYFLPDYFHYLFCFFAGLLSLLVLHFLPDYFHYLSVTMMIVNKIVFVHVNTVQVVICVVSQGQH